MASATRRRAEAALYESGATTRLGTIQDQNTVSDYDEDEHKRKFSLNLAILPVEWEGRTINIIDTPGNADFISEVICGANATDMALVVVDAVSGPEVGTDRTWNITEKLGLPRMIVVNVPEFVLRAYEVAADGRIELRLAMKVIVGQALRTQTPLLDEELRSIELSPYWNVQPSIARQELVPELRRSPGVWTREGYEFVTAGGAAATALTEGGLDAVLTHPTLHPADQPRREGLRSSNRFRITRFYP